MLGFGENRIKKREKVKNDNILDSFNLVFLLNIYREK